MTILWHGVIFVGLKYVSQFLSPMIANIIESILNKLNATLKDSSQSGEENKSNNQDSVKIDTVPAANWKNNNFDVGSLISSAGTMLSGIMGGNNNKPKQKNENNTDARREARRGPRF